MKAHDHRKGPASDAPTIAKSTSLENEHSPTWRCAQMLRVMYHSREREPAMRFRDFVVVALLLLTPTISFAQSPNPLTANAKIQFGALSGFVLKSAEKVPEDLYTFRATPDVRLARQPDCAARHAVAVRSG